MRLVTAAFGIVLVVLAMVIVLYGDSSWGTAVAALCVGWLGVDACVSAVRNRRSLLERIGPLP